ncbi:GyrI-like domain-containing protein [Enterococcus cecorum]|uniref:GyrI-like domain-containing protein n=1 Tax=Enterococcus cecorum TaxID=44008 RepID=UPI00148D4463|nr:GyrI-like domain-containing protein [Enterococcus cecorum]MCJ0574868.1 GyrI-like domain-containing protein [Enterococcus cecorum]MCJ0576854.1 GyrI-like domain-containing protein [Enterococcus cecorum]
MAFDYKKEFKQLYQPKKQPTIITIPKMKFLGIYGQGDPNDVNGDYQKAIQELYTLSYTLKMSYKTDYEILGFFEYVVPPLEGFWWQMGTQGYDQTRKDLFQWLSVIRVPDFVTEKDFEWAKKQALTKKKLSSITANLLTIDEGEVLQMLHVGPYDEEVHSLKVMEAFLEEAGYENDFSTSRHHHEIYLSDPRRCAPEKLKTILRHPVRSKR